ncbi:MAG TPA: response regulator transcription factor [Candidatus Saccharimonadales bacterium]|nr:response regulator transcription factor [Candidatus Saccharimonadales bacterium]
MRILVIEDEPKIAQAVKQGLELKGYAVDMVHDADDGLSYATDPDYDAIVLDRMLPGSMDGVELCRKLRADGVSTPIIMLTARGTIGDRVEGLNGGADDYLVKPFSFDELTARVRALLRRPKAQVGTSLQVGDLQLDTANYEVKRAGTPIKLSHKEFALLEYFMHHPDQVITKDMLISHVWDEAADILPNTIEVYVGYLRNKIDRPFADQKPLLHTLRGFGYKLSAA